MKIKRHLFFAVLCIAATLPGCAQWTITGQNYLRKVKADASGQNPSEHELVGIYTIQDGIGTKSSETAKTAGKGVESGEDDGTRSIKLRSDAVSISLKTLYLKYIQSCVDFDIVVYAEVYDVIDEKKVLKRVAFHRLNQPSHSYLNVAGNLLYGPIFYEGNPITIKFYVFELDKKNNELFSQLLKTVSSVASAAQPQYGTAIETASSIMQFIISMNQDDLELSQEITLYPLSGIEKMHYGGKVSLVPPLEVGDLVIVKREDQDRAVINRWWRSDEKGKEEAEKVFDSSKVHYDATTGRLTLNNQDFEDKTYAVLTVSRPSKAANFEMLKEISTNVQKDLNDTLINTSQAEEDKIADIKKIGSTAEALVRTFEIRNSISGKKPSQKEDILAKKYKKCGNSEADERVKREIERLWEEESGKTVDELKKLTETPKEQNSKEQSKEHSGNTEK